MKNIKVLLILLVAISCYSCSGKLFNKITGKYLYRNIECYYSAFDLTIYGNDMYDIRNAMEVLFHKYPETNISLEILKQLENTDTILGINGKRPSLKELQHSSQKEFSKLASRDDNLSHFGWWVIYRLKSPTTNNVFVFNSSGCIICVFMASDNFKPYYLQDFTFAEEKAIEKEFEKELLPKIEECIKKVQYLKKYRIWREDLE